MAAIGTLFILWRHGRGIATRQAAYDEFPALAME